MEYYTCDNCKKDFNPKNDNFKIINNELVCPNCYSNDIRFFSIIKSKPFEPTNKTYIQAIGRKFRYKEKEASGISPRSETIIVLIIILLILILLNAIMS